MGPRLQPAPFTTAQTARQTETVNHFLNIVRSPLGAQISWISVRRVNGLPLGKSLVRALLPGARVDAFALHARAQRLQHRGQVDVLGDKPDRAIGETKVRATVV